MKPFAERPRNRQLSREEAVGQFGIWEDDLVLDVGCGGDPDFTTHFLRADVLIDADLEVKKFYVGSRMKFLIAKAEALPFKDKIFQFVYCCHVIEHTDNPAVACNELSRAGKRGYILCPSKLAEILRPFDYHNWMVSKFGEKLLFQKKPGFLYPEIKWQQKLLPIIERKKLKEIEFKLPASIFNVIYSWFNRIEFEVEKTR